MQRDRVFAPLAFSFEGPIRRPERGGEWESEKFSLKDELGLCHKFTI
jgi:hypothetical protein